MRTIFSEDQQKHDGGRELFEAISSQCSGFPDALRSCSIASGRSSARFCRRRISVWGRSSVFTITVWSNSCGSPGTTGPPQGGPSTPFAHVWPVPGLGRRLSGNIDGRLGYYAIDAGTPIMAGTWAAITASANVALTAQKLVATGEQAAFALCRPPGHHAGHDFYGGYCFFNGGLRRSRLDLRRSGRQRVAILDVDYHHGNGTQQIFYARDDVCSPCRCMPTKQNTLFHRLCRQRSAPGRAKAIISTCPLPWGADWSALRKAACRWPWRASRQYKPEALVISLGLRYFQARPNLALQVAATDYLRMGQLISWAELPTLFVFEGLCGGGSRHQHGERAPRLRRRLKTYRRPSSAVAMPYFSITAKPSAVADLSRASALALSPWISASWQNEIDVEGLIAHLCALRLGDRAPVARSPPDEVSDDRHQPFVQLIRRDIAAQR